MKLRNPFAIAFISVTALVCTLVLLELGAQFTVRHVLQHGRLFQADPVLGWKPIPNLSLVRRNAAGEPWLIQTNENGFRGAGDWRVPAERRLLILGDSHAFGEGVNLQDRFDAWISRHMPSWSIVNLGVPGYGADQEIIAGRSYFPSMKPGDIVLLLSSSADFRRITNKYHSGRAKPWFASETGGLVEHPPAVGLLQSIRDGSYLAGRLMRVLQIHQSATGEEYYNPGGVDLYHKLLKEELEPLLERGILVVIAYHGLLGKGEALIGRLEEEGGFNTVALDEVLNDPSCLLTDGHWSAEGHRSVGHALLRKMENIL